MDFGWVDATAGPLSPYRPWGQAQPVFTVPPWLCGGVNMSQLLSFAGTWMNAPCTRSMPFMCRWGTADCTSHSGRTGQPSAASSSSWCTRSVSSFRVRGSAVSMPRSCCPAHSGTTSPLDDAHALAAAALSALDKGRAHQPLLRSPCRLLRPAVNVTITANSTGNSFTLRAPAVNQSTAEAACQAVGGHLASFASADEQLDVETALAATGYLLPAFHKSYWLGLSSSDDAWPQFRYLACLTNVCICKHNLVVPCLCLAHAPAPCSSICSSIGSRMVSKHQLHPHRWTDRALVDPGINDSFANWGTMAVGEQLYAEPNNLGLQENCAVANFSQATGVPAMAGWSDAQCSAAAVYICKQQRKSTQLVAPALLPVCCF